MFKRYRLKREIGMLELEQRKSLFGYINQNMQQLAEASNIVQKEEDSDWILHGSEAGYRPTEEEHREMLEQAYRLWRTNLHARAIVRTMVKFVVGKGANIMPKDKNEKVKEIIVNFKRESSSKENMAKKRKWNLKEKEIFVRFFRDGEVIMRLFKGGTNEDGLVKIRFIRPGKVRTPTGLKVDDKDLHKGEKVSFGIGHNPDDVEDYKHYYICDDHGELQSRIPAEEILHYKLFADADMKRGISLLEVCAPMLKKYKDWMEDRIVLNKVRTAIALVKHVDAPTAQIQALRDNLESETKESDRKKTKMLERGTVITTGPNVKYELLSPNINASDVAEDGRNMLLSVAAGVGFPEMILTADYSNANYSSTMIAQNPFVREIEDWQDFAETIYSDIFGAVIQNAIDHGPLPKNTSTEVDVEFQPLIHQDIKQEDEAMEIEYRNKVVSRKTWQLKRGLDPETEKVHMQDEQGDDAYNPMANEG
ncbi:MAG: phage portal protein [Pseudomonadota bacterium]